MAARLAKTAVVLRSKLAFEVVLSEVQIMRQALYTLILGLAGSVTALPQSSDAVAGTFANPPQGAPVIIPRAKQYDITSQITGRTYRIMVSIPINADLTK